MKRALHLKKVKFMKSYDWSLSLVWKITILSKLKFASLWFMGGDTFETLFEKNKHGEPL